MSLLPFLSITGSAIRITSQVRSFKPVPSSNSRSRASRSFQFFVRVSVPYLSINILEKPRLLAAVNAFKPDMRKTCVANELDIFAAFSALQCTDVKPSSAQRAIVPIVSSVAKPRLCASSRSALLAGLS